MNNLFEFAITAITPNGSATLPFVIPSAAEGSAVLLTDLLFPSYSCRTAFTRLRGLSTSIPF